MKLRLPRPLCPFDRAAILDHMNFDRSGGNQDSLISSRKKAYFSSNTTSSRPQIQKSVNVDEEYANVADFLQELFPMTDGALKDANCAIDEQPPEVVGTNATRDDVTTVARFTKEVQSLLDAADGSFGEEVKKLATRFTTNFTLGQLQEMLQSTTSFSAPSAWNFEHRVAQQFFGSKILSQLKIYCSKYNDRRLSENFILPPPSEQQFYPHLPIGTDILDSHFTHMDQDHISRQILGDLREHHLGTLQVSQVHHMFLLSFILPKFKEMSLRQSTGNIERSKNNAIWFRQWIYVQRSVNFNGRIEVERRPAWLLTRAERLDNGNYLVRIQDITGQDEIKNLKLLPLLEANKIV